MRIFTCATNETVRNDIPDDLALCILSKMPIKSLKRFGCIRKSWAPLFKNQHFMSIYRNNFISNHHSDYDDTSLLLQASEHDFHFLYGERYENIVKLDCPNPFDWENPSFGILDSGSITGILCLYMTNFEETVVLWNPATNELKCIPSSPLEFGSICSYCVQGFGYDHMKDDYKLIRTICKDGLCGDISYPITLWEMYSLKSNSWRKLDIDNSVTHNFCSRAGARLYMNGICHWLYKDGITHWCLSGIIDFTCINENTLVSFDLVNEVIYSTPIPSDISSLDEVGADRYLVALNGSIALISWFGTTFDIFILGELRVKESWTKLFTVGPLSCVETPIGTGNKGNIFFRKYDGGIVWFDLGSEKIEELGINGIDYSHVLFYKKNLLSIGDSFHF